MVKILKKTRVDETIINMGNIDPQVCKNTMLGEVTEENNCLVKIRRVDTDPEHAELEMIRYQPNPKMLRKD